MNLKKLLTAVVLFNIHELNYSSAALVQNSRKIINNPNLKTATTNLINTTTSSIDSMETQSTSTAANYTVQPIQAPRLNSKTIPFKPIATNEQQRSFSTSTNTSYDSLSYENLLQIFNRNALLFDSNFDVKKNAHYCSGQSLENVKIIIQNAYKIARQNNLEKINNNCMLDALANVIFSPKKSNQISLPNEHGIIIIIPTEQVALHEAAHAIIELNYPTGHIICAIHGDSREECDGVNMISWPHNTKPYNKKHNIDSIIVAFAGVVSEQIFNLHKLTAMFTNYDEIINFIKITFDRSAGDYDLIETNIHELIEHESLTEKAMEQLIIDCYQKSYKYIKEHKQEIRQLADLIIQKGSVYEDEIYALANKPKPLFHFQSGPLPQEHADQYFYRGQSNPYGYDAKGNYVGSSGIRDKNGNLEEIN